jgi:hypothetical protein
MGRGWRSRYIQRSAGGIGLVLRFRALWRATATPPADPGYPGWGIAERLRVRSTQKLYV